MERRAQLGEFAGTGSLSWGRDESGQPLLTGLWQADDPEHAYDELHRLYMARERIPFRGTVITGGEADGEETHEVIILEWSNEGHPAALKLQVVTEEY